MNFDQENASTHQLIFICLQKLSFYGDLDYLSQLNDKTLLANIHPQDKMEAAPLPIKVRVERI